MLGLTGVLLKKAITGLLSLCLTEKMVVGIVLQLLSHLAKKTKMPVDDHIIKELQKEYEKKYQ